jgi:hypothetical protein
MLWQKIFADYPSMQLLELTLGVFKAEVIGLQQSDVDVSRQSTFLQRLGRKPIPTTPQMVKVANGDTSLTYHYLSNQEWWIQGHSFFTDMKVIEPGAYDCILGYDWLKKYSPIMHDWEAKTMEFSDGNTQVKLQGIQQAPLSLHEIQADTLVKWAAGNDIWAWVVVDMLPPLEDTKIPSKALPPPRLFDHTIPTLPDAIPVNSRPYRYSPYIKMK